MSSRFDSGFVERFIHGATYEGVDHEEAARISYRLSKKYDFISQDQLLYGWGVLSLEEKALKVSNKELDVLYAAVRLNARNLMNSITPWQVSVEIDGADELVSVLGKLIEIETPKRGKLQHMNECMFLGHVARIYDRVCPHRHFKGNDLLIKAALEIQSVFSFRQQHVPAVIRDDPSSLNKYLQRGRKLLRVTARERHRMTE